MNSIALVTTLLAAVPVPAPTTAPAPAWFDALRNPLFILPGLLILWMMLSGNKGKRADEKQRLEMLKNLKRGDRIQTIGGVLGAVVRAEADRVEVKVDESSNVKIWFARNAISKVVVETDKAEAAK